MRDWGAKLPSLSKKDLPLSRTTRTTKNYSCQRERGQGDRAQIPPQYRLIFANLSRKIVV